MAHDRFGVDYQALSQPVREAVSVDLTNDTSFTDYPRGVYVGVTGDLKVDLLDSANKTFKNIAAGIIHPIRVKKIYSTGNGTSATDILVLY